MTRAAIYARISNADPEVDAISDQLRRCRDLAEREGYEVVAEFSDDGVSGWASKVRLGWIELDRAVRAGQVDVVLAVAEDRFTRSAEVKTGFQAACAKAKVTWHTIAGGNVNPATAGGKLLSTITGGIAEYESDLKSERVAASVVRRRLEGRDITGPRPFGWTADRRSLMPAEAELVRLGHQMVLDGHTTYAIAKAFRASGVPPVKGGMWSPRNIYVQLLRPRNAGFVKDAEGNEYDVPDMPGIVSREDHEAVVAALTANRDTSGRKPQHLASGRVAQCGVCGSGLTYKSRKGVPAYRCSRSKIGQEGDGRRHAFIGSDELDHRIRLEVFRALKQRLRDESDPASDGAEVRALVIQRAELDRQRAAAQEVALMPGADMQLARRTIAQLASQIAEVSAQILDARTVGIGAVQEVAQVMLDALSASEDASSESDALVGVLASAASASAVFNKRWAALSLDEQRDLALSLIDVKVYPEREARQTLLVPTEDGQVEVRVLREGPERVTVSAR